MSVIELVRDIWMNDACVKFESFKIYRAKNEIVTHGGGGRGCVADENIIFPKTYVSREYNYCHNIYELCDMPTSMFAA